MPYPLPVARAATEPKGKAAEANKALEGVRADATKYGYRDFEFRARLALGQLALLSNASAGRSQLIQLQRDALVLASSVLLAKLRTLCNRDWLGPSLEFSMASLPLQNSAITRFLRLRREPFQLFWRLSVQSPRPK